MIRTFFKKLLGLSFMLLVMTLSMVGLYLLMLYLS